MIAPDDPQLRRIGEPGERGLILYDGDCVLCSNWFRFVAQRDAEGKFLFTAIQSPYGRALAVRHGIDPNNPQSNAVLLDGNVKKVLISVALWLPYLLMSKRVNVTFRHRVEA